MVNWTEKRVDRLKLLHREGLSAAGIARKLGPAFTKGMVAGKLRRLGVVAEGSPAGAKAVAVRNFVSSRNAALRGAGGAKPAAAPAPSKALVPIVAPKAAKPITVEHAPVASKGIRLYDLREGHCRWPLGDAPVRFFCGAPSVGATSWCEIHQRIAFSGARPASPLRQAAAVAARLTVKRW